jgi:ankyrin repeat protein
VKQSPEAEQAPGGTAAATAKAPAATDLAGVTKKTAPSPAANAALLQACKDNDRDGVGRALEAGANANTADEDGRTPLMWACFDGRDSIAATLLEHKARVNDQDAVGRTALMYASTGAFRDTVRLLLLHGAEVNLRDRAEGFTALMFAAAEGQLEVVKELLAHHADRQIVDVDGDKAADFARRNGHAQVVQVLEQ